ncbi:MgtC/SapB family protein, partial [Oenococcus oeni]
MNDTYLITQIGLLLRLIVAGVCGFAIGYERKSRLKEAGVRTHMIVALGAALIMIVSKYGFVDVVQLKGYVLDPSRIAAQIVSGIGFLGAGMIFVRKQAINGLTTAAGVWTTAGVGMAIGAKLYFIGVSATV